MEEHGFAFYEGLWQGTNSDLVRKLARMMMKAEQRHRQRFLSYAQRAEESDDAGDDRLTGALPPEVLRLLKTGVFVPKGRSVKAAEYAQDEEVLNIAITAEQTLALLLTELRQYVPRGQRRFIDHVTKQEWGHKAKLEQVLRKTVNKHRISRNVGKGRAPAASAQDLGK